MIKNAPSDKKIHFCTHCERILLEDFRYCPWCGFRRHGFGFKPLRSCTILYILLLIMSASFFVIGFKIYNAQDPLGTILFSLGTAIGPVAIIGLIYEYLLKDSLREAALRSYSEFSETAFQNTLLDLSKHKQSLEELIKRLLHIGNVGLVGVFPERRYAFAYIEEAIATEEKEIIIVGTSFRGLFWPTPGEEKIMFLLSEKIKSNLCNVKFILTHPAFAHLRQSLEAVQRRDNFHIAQEILETVKILRDAGVPHQNIRFVKGTPTIFGFMTSKMMLLNPYPLQLQAYSSLTFLIDSINGENPVYRAFERAHFRGVWDGNNVDSIEGYTAGALQKVFDESLDSMGLCSTNRKINYEILEKKC